MFNTIVGTILALGTPLAFFPATVKMVKMNSTASMSIFTQICLTIQNVWQCAGIIGESAPLLVACSVASAGQCYGNLVPFVQGVAQSLGVLTVGIPFAVLWIRGEVPTENGDSQLKMDTVPGALDQGSGGQPLVEGESGLQTAEQAEHYSWIAPPDECACMSRGLQKALLLFHFAATAFVMVFMIVLPVVVGPCASLVLTSRNVFVTVAAVAQFVGPFPQIVLLLRTKDPGALSGVFLLVTGFGSGLLVVTFLGAGTSLWAVLPYIVGAIEQTIQFFLWLLYACRKSRRGEHVVWL